MITDAQRERLNRAQFLTPPTLEDNPVHAAVEEILAPYQATIARVEALHARVRRHHYWVCEACSDDDGPGTPWPCDTVAALAASDPQEEGDHAETEPFLVPPAWVQADMINNLAYDQHRLLTYADGTVRFEHRCDRGERGTIICAPALQIGNGHSLTYGTCVRPDCQGTHDAPTVTPSILCPDCGTHGFITNGRWADA